MMKLINHLYKISGIAFLFLAKVKAFINGYSSPKPFSIEEIDRCFEYDTNVVKHWFKHLESYTKQPIYYKDKNVLELGPGSDLGVGLYLLSKGVLKYNAIDVNNLVKDVPLIFYDHFFTWLKNSESELELSDLKRQLELTNNSENDKLNYIHRPDFNILNEFGFNSIDIVFSQAAFEHFENIEKTIEQLSKVVKSGGLLITEIDLKTHTRWIRDKDPNNIYRFSEWFYELFKFSGIPNRKRPYQYKQILEDNGWENIIIKPLLTLNKNEYSDIRNSLNNEFQDDKNQMQYLTIMLCAQKK